MVNTQFGTLLKGGDCSWAKDPSFSLASYDSNDPIKGHDELLTVLISDLIADLAKVKGAPS